MVSWHWTQAHPEENTDEQPNFTVGSEEWVSRRRRWQLQHKLQLWSGPAPADHQNSSYGNIRLVINYNLVGGRSRFACQVMLVTSGCSFIRPEVQAASCRVWLVIITCWPVCIFICIVNCIVRFIVYLLIYTPSRSSNLWQYIRVHGHDSTVTISVPANLLTTAYTVQLKGSCEMASLVRELTMWWRGNGLVWQQSQSMSIR